MEPEDLTRIIKPPKCPECGEPLFSLIHVWIEDVTEEVTLERGEFKTVETLEKCFHESFLCPICWHELTSNPKEAKQLLRGEK